MMRAKESYHAVPLPEAYGQIDYAMIMDDLIDATAAFEVYKEKIRDSKVSPTWFMPTLQQNEALKSSMMEGTQATLDGVLINQINPNENDRNLNEVENYFNATIQGHKMLRRGDFDDEFFCTVHKTLLSGKVRKNVADIGKYRSSQNYIAENDGTIIYTPPEADNVPTLMRNLIDFMNMPNKSLRPLVQIAVIHAQFETIHPFLDGNGRVGRILIPLFLYARGEIEAPYFFISDALEKDKHKYYSYLMNIRKKGEWNEWICFFLQTVTKQCRKFIELIDKINRLYQQHMEEACKIIRSSSYVVNIIDVMFKYPVFNAAKMQQEVDIPLATLNRYLNLLVDNKILFTDQKKRNKTYFYYDLLELFRE